MPTVNKAMTNASARYELGLRRAHKNACESLRQGRPLPDVIHTLRERYRMEWEDLNRNVPTWAQEQA